MGLGVSTYRGRTIVSHGGGIDGFISAMSWLPEERIGIVVLSNLSGQNPVPTLVMRTLYDRLLEVPPADWVARQRKADADQAARQAKQVAARQAERQPGTSPSHPLADYVGSSEHLGYGTVRVSLQGGALSLALEPHVVRLEHFHFDVWEIRDPGGAVPFGGRLRFLSNLKGEIDRIAVPLEPAGADIIFARPVQ